MKLMNKVILGSIVIYCVFIQSSFATTGKVNTTAVRIREENNTNANILTNIYENDEVEILEETGDWYKIQYKTYTGYVKKDYINQINNSDNSNNTSTNTNTSTNANTNTNMNTNTNTNTDNHSGSANTNNDYTTKGTLKMTSQLRMLPSYFSTQTEEISQGAEVTILTEMNHWVQITDGVVSGWLLKTKIADAMAPVIIDNEETTATDTEKNTAQENVANRIENQTINPQENTSHSANNETVAQEVTSQTTGKINVETARVRASASTSAEAVNVLDYGDEVTISAEEGDWYKISSGNITGYVSKKLVTITNNKEDDNITSRSLSQDRGINGNSVVEFAKQYLGYAYILGGKTPATGFDCSGFTQYVFAHFEYQLANTASDQTNVGREIAREDLKEGDLILFYDEGKTKIGHTGIYIGNGDFIHAANPKRGVVIDNVNSNSYYNERYVTARRIIE